MANRSIDGKTHADLFYDDGYRAFMLTRQNAHAEFAFGRKPLRLARRDAGRAFAGLRHVVDHLVGSLAKARLHRVALRLNRERI